MNTLTEQATEQCRMCSHTNDADETEIDMHQHIMDEHSLRERLFALHETVTVSDEVRG